jgi:hypothetical protein
VCSRATFRARYRRAPPMARLAHPAAHSYLGSSGPVASRDASPQRLTFPHARARFHPGRYGMVSCTPRGSPIFVCEGSGSPVRPGSALVLGMCSAAGLPPVRPVPTQPLRATSTHRPPGDRSAITSVLGGSPRVSPERGLVKGAVESDSSSFAVVKVRRPLCDRPAQKITLWVE